MSSLTFGTVYRDRITGFKGRATGKAQYISGCNQILLAPEVDESGKFCDPQWFDEQRVEIAGGGGTPIVLDNGANPGPDKAAPKR